MVRRSVRQHECSPPRQPCRPQAYPWAITRRTRAILITRYRPVIPIKANKRNATLGDRRRRQSRESVYLRRAQPNSQPGSERGRFGVALAWWAPGTSQSSDERPALALLSRKLDYTAADPPKLRPGLVSARPSPFARNGARPSECLLFTPIPSRPDCFVFLLCTRLTRFPTPTLVTVSS